MQRFKIRLGGRSNVLLIDNIIGQPEPNQNAYNCIYKHLLHQKTGLETSLLLNKK